METQQVGLSIPPGNGELLRSPTNNFKSCRPTALLIGRLNRSGCIGWMWSDSQPQPQFFILHPALFFCSQGVLIFLTFHVVSRALCLWPIFLGGLEERARLEWQQDRMVLRRRHNTGAVAVLLPRVRERGGHRSGQVGRAALAHRRRQQLQLLPICPWI